MRRATALNCVHKVTWENASRRKSPSEFQQKLIEEGKSSRNQFDIKISSLRGSAPPPIHAESIPMRHWKQSLAFCTNLAVFSGKTVSNAGLPSWIVASLFCFSVRATARNWPIAMNRTSTLFGVAPNFERFLVAASTYSPFAILFFVKSNPTKDELQMLDQFSDGHE